MGREELGVGERERASQLHAHGCYIKDYIYTAITNPATSHVHVHGTHIVADHPVY